MIRHVLPLQSLHYEDVTNQPPPDDPVTNLALPLFEPGLDDATLVAFHPNDEKLNIQGYIDDRVVPAKTGPTQAYYRWYVCETYYVGCKWALGIIFHAYDERRLTCEKIGIRRSRG